VFIDLCFINDKCYCVLNQSFTKCISCLIVTFVKWGSYGFMLGVSINHELEKLNELLIDLVEITLEFSMSFHFIPLIFFIKN